MPKYYDVLVIGSGAAGLGLALSLADTYRVAVICKDNLLASSSQNAQGGIAAVMNKDDSYAEHISDTEKAGAGLCDSVVVEYTVKQAKQAISWLVKKGVQFTTDSEKSATLHLTQEGGHTRRRIVHALDKTGSAVVKTLSQQVLEHPNIMSLTEHMAIEIISADNRCFGAYFLDNKSNCIKTILAKFTVLATGGASMCYLHTSNSSHTTGDGIAMAARAGARVANMEFNQFHPTCFYNPTGKSFLITEVMRGEGGKLILENGERFMPRYHPQEELAPRDIVARAIVTEMKLNQLTHVYLDISQEPREKILRLFPTLYELCKAEGLDITQKPIPVVPAAHYTCGGVITNLKGQTDILHLYAVGEVACTGLHGANRMASNSLLECLVFARSAAEAILADQPTTDFTPPAIKSITQSINSKDDKLLEKLILEIRTLVWDNAGILRSNEKLQFATQKLEELRLKIKNLHQTANYSKNHLELQNLLLIARLIVKLASDRHESRGVHYNQDYPNLATEALNSLARLTDDNIVLTYSKEIHSLVNYSD